MRTFFSILLPAALLAAPPVALTPAQRELHLQSFDHVWKTVAARHWDPTLGGLDWQKVRDELRPKVEGAKDVEAVRAALHELLGRLQQTHFGIVPADVYTDLASAAKGSGTPGLELRPVEGRAVVVEVLPGSPAAQAGVKPGWELVRVKGQDVAPLFAKLDAAFQVSTQRDLILTRRIQGLLDGALEEAVEADFHDGTKRVQVQLRRVEPRGRMLTFGNMPPTAFWLERKALPEGIRYLRFSLWMDPEAVAEAFRASLREGGPVRGFVLDLRGNPGGIGGMAMGAAGWFTDRTDRKLGTMVLRGSSLKFIVNPRPEPFQGPLAILVDGCSGSTSEIFAGGMQDLKRARVFGSRSAGAALPSVFERLPNGDGFQFAIANYVSDGGQPLEGRGVTPDEPVPLTRSALLAGRDPVLDRAIAWITASTR